MFSLKTFAWALVAAFSVASMAAGGVVWYGDEHTFPGGDGTWDDATTANWSNDSGASFINWSAGDFAAVFSGSETTSAVTVSGTINQVNSMDFQSAGYTLTGTSSDKLILGGTGTITTGFDATIRAILDGSVGLTKAGTATLTLDGADPNTFSGSVNIQAGTLSVNDNSKLGVGTNPVFLGTAAGVATLKYTGATGSSNRVIVLGTLAGSSTGDIIEVATPGADLTWSGGIGGGPLAGNTALTIQGAGRLIFGAASNGFTGNLRIDGGTLRFGDNLQLGGTAANTIFLGTASSIGTLEYTGPTVTITRTLTLGSLAGSSTGDIIQVTGNDLTWDGVIGGGAAAGNTSLTVKGTGRLILLTARTHTFTGNILIDGGTLVANGQRSFGAAVAKTVTLSNGGTLATSATYDPGAGTISVVLGSGGGKIDAAGGTILTLNDAGQFAGTGDLTKRGTGTLLLGAGAVSYPSFDGNTKIYEGSIRVLNADALGDGSPSQTVTVYGGRLSANIGTFPRDIVLEGTGTLASMGGDRTFSGNVTINGTPTFVMANDGDPTNATGRKITLTGVVSGSGKITIKPGTGVSNTFTMNNNSNTFTGDVELDALASGRVDLLYPINAPSGQDFLARAGTMNIGRAASSTDLGKPVTIGSGATVTATGTGTIINIRGTGAALGDIGTTIAGGAQVIAETGGTITVGTTSDGDEFRCQVNDDALIWAKGGTITISGRSNASPPPYATVVAGDVKATAGGTVYIGYNGSDNEHRISFVNTANLIADGGTIHLRHRNAALTLSTSNMGSITVINGGALFLSGNNANASGNLNISVIHDVGGVPTQWTLGKDGDNDTPVFTINRESTPGAGDGITDTKGLTLQSNRGTIRYNSGTVTIIDAFDPNPLNWVDGEVKVTLRRGTVDISTAAGSTFNYKDGIAISGWGTLGTSTANQTHVIPATTGVTFYATDAAATAQSLKITGGILETTAKAKFQIGEADTLWLAVPTATAYEVGAGKIAVDSQTGTNLATFQTTGGVTAYKAAFVLSGAEVNKLKLDVRGGTFRTDLSGPETLLVANAALDINAPVYMLSAGSGNTGGTFITTAPTFTVGQFDAVLGTGTTAGTVWASPDGGVTITQLEIDGLVDAGGTAGWTIGGYIQPTSTGILRLDGGETTTLAAGGDLTSMTLGYAGTTGAATLNVNGALTTVILGKNGATTTQFTAPFTGGFAGNRQFRTTAGVLQLNVVGANVEIDGTSQLRADTGTGAGMFALGTLSMNGGQFVPFYQPDNGTTPINSKVNAFSTLSGKGIYGSSTNPGKFLNSGTVSASVAGTLQINASLDATTALAPGGITATAGAAWQGISGATLILNGNLSDTYDAGNPPISYALVWDQPGILYLMQTNSFSGGTTITNSDVYAYATNAMGTGPVVLNNPAGGTVDARLFLEVADAADLANTITLSSTSTAGKDASVVARAENAMRGVTVNLGPLAQIRMRADVDAAMGGDVFLQSDTAKITVDRVASTGTAVDKTLSVNSLTLGTATGATTLQVDRGANNSTGYIFKVDGTTTFTGGAITVNTASTNFWGAILGGGITETAPSSLVKTGPATLVLGGPGVYTGPTTLNAGTLAFGDDSALPAGTTLTINGGAIQAYGLPRSVPNDITVGANFGISGSQNLTLTGAVNLGGANRRITVTNTGDSTVDKPLGYTAGGGLVEKDGAGKLILKGDNSNLPALRVFNGEVRIPSGAALTSNTVNVGFFTTGAPTPQDGTLVIDAGATFAVGSPTVPGELNIGSRDAATGAAIKGMLDLSATGFGGDPAASIHVTELRIGSRIDTATTGDSDLGGTLKLGNNTVITADTQVVVNTMRQINELPSYIIVGSGSSAIYSPQISIGAARAQGGGFIQDATGGTLSIAGIGAGVRVTDFYIARANFDGAAATLGSVDMTGGTLIASIDNLYIAWSGNNNVTGSTTGSLILGTSALNNVDVNSITVGHKEDVGADVNATLTMRGGNLSVGAGGITIADLTSSGTCNGTVNLEGGSVTFASGSAGVTDGGGNSTLNLQGATLNMAGAVIGSAGNPINNLLLASGKLENVAQINGGAAVTLAPLGGLLTVGGTNTWTGPTLIADGSSVTLAAGTTLAATTITVGTFPGTAAVLNASAGGYSVPSGQTLQGHGTVIGAVTVAGGTVQAGTAGVVGTLTFDPTSTLTFNAGTLLTFDADTAGTPGTSDRIDVQNNVLDSLNIAGSTTVNINPLGGFGAGTYGLMKYGSGGITPAKFANLGLDRTTIPTDYAAALVNNTAGSQVELSVVEGKRWFGATSDFGPEDNTWDIGTTQNWKTAIGGVFAPYLEGTPPDTVTFDDASYSLGPNLTVNVSTNVAPYRISVDSSWKNYEFVGTGGIGGGADLTKTGAGWLKISNTGTNNWTGGTRLQSGTLYNGRDNALPTAGALTLGGGSADATYDLNGFDQELGGLADAGGSFLRTVNNGGAPKTLTINTAGSYRFDGTVGGSLSLVKKGSGAQAFTGANSFGGETTIEAGTVVVGSDTALSFGRIKLTGSTAVLSLGEVYQPGLWSGRLGSNQDWTSPNPNSFISPGPDNANNSVANDGGSGTGWQDDTTWVYTGEIYFPADALVSFGKSFDDSYQLKLDGSVVVTHTQYNAISVTTIPVTAGWHDFEVRFAQGVGGVGPKNGWTIGFGIDLAGNNSTSQSYYTYPTGPTWFRAGAISSLSLSNSIDVSADATIRMSPGLTASTSGNLNIDNNVLTVSGGGSFTVNGTTTFDGPAAPTFNVESGTTLRLAGQIIEPAAGYKLQKTGRGTLNVSYAFNNAFSGGVDVGSGGTLQALAGGKILGTGGPVSTQPTGILRINPGAAVTADLTVATSATNDGLLHVSTGVADFGTLAIGPGAGPHATQPLKVGPDSKLTEYYAKPSDVGAADFGTANAGNAFIQFENANNFITPLPGPGSSSDLTAGTLLSFTAKVLDSRSAGYLGSVTDVGAAWKGTIEIGGASPIPAGWVTFGTRSDDGSSVYVDFGDGLGGLPDGIFQANELVVNNLNTHTIQARVGSVNLAAGTYNIAIGYYQGGTNDFIEARVAPGIVAQADYANMAIVSPNGKLYPSRILIDLGAELQAGAVTADQLVVNGTLTLRNASANSSAAMLQLSDTVTINLPTDHVLAVGSAINTGINNAAVTLNVAGPGTLKIDGLQNYTRGTTINLSGSKVAFNSDGGRRLTLAVPAAATGEVSVGAGYTELVANVVIGDGATLKKTGAGTLATANFTPPVTAAVTGTVNVDAGVVAVTGANVFNATPTIAWGDDSNTLQLLGSAAATADKLLFNVTDPATAVTFTGTTDPNIHVNDGATLELAGTVPVLADAGLTKFVDVVNDSTTLGLVVSGQNQQAGHVTGIGATTIQAGADLTASSLRQSSVTLSGGVGSPARLIIAPSGSGRPASLGLGGGQALLGGAGLGRQAVPEPGTLGLIGIGGLCLAGYLWRRRRSAW